MGNQGVDQVTVDPKNTDIELSTNSPDDTRASIKFGFVTAGPSEFIIFFRKGKIKEKFCRQGATVFKGFRDTVFIVPTSLKEIAYKASQLTKDNVDVSVRGMAVYHISDPLKIYKLINFTHRQNAEAKLAKMIGDLCRSTAKWLVSNMTVEETIRKRKEEIADVLKKEVETVVADWGVKVTTIDVNDIFINDEEIFRAMQQRFKAEKMREAEVAQIEMERTLEEKRLETEKELSEQRKQNEIMKATHESQIEDEKIRLRRAQAEKQFELSQYQMQEKNKQADMQQDSEIAREKKDLQLQIEKKQKQVEMKQMEASQALEALAKRIKTENEASESSNDRLLYEVTLPKVISQVAEHLGSSQFTYYQSDGQMPLEMAVKELMGMLSQIKGSARE